MHGMAELKACAAGRHRGLDLPLTPETAGLIGGRRSRHEALGRARECRARPLVDETALIEPCGDDRGCRTRFVTEEPLPAASPLWGMRMCSSRRTPRARRAATRRTSSTFCWKTSTGCGAARPPLRMSSFGRPPECGPTHPHALDITGQKASSRSGRCRAPARPSAEGAEMGEKRDVPRNIAR